MEENSITVAPNVILQRENEHHSSPAADVNSMLDFNRRRSKRIVQSNIIRFGNDTDLGIDAIPNDKLTMTVDDAIERLAKRVIYLDDRDKYFTDENLDKFCSKLSNDLVDEIEQQYVICVTQIANIFRKYAENNVECGVKTKQLATRIKMFKCKQIPGGRPIDKDTDYLTNNDDTSNEVEKELSFDLNGFGAFNSLLGMAHNDNVTPTMPIIASVQKNVCQADEIYAKGRTNYYQTAFEQNELENKTSSQASNYHSVVAPNTIPNVVQIIDKQCSKEDSLTTNNDTLNYKPVSNVMKSLSEPCNINDNNQSNKNPGRLKQVKSFADRVANYAHHDLFNNQEWYEKIHLTDHEQQGLIGPSLDEQQRQDELRQADQQRQDELQRQADQQRQNDQQRQAELQRQADQQRQNEQQRQAELQRQADQQRQVELRQANQQRQADQQRQAEQQRQADQQRQFELRQAALFQTEQQRQAKLRQAEQQRQAALLQAEQQLQAEEQRQAKFRIAEQQRLVEQQRQAVWRRQAELPKADGNEGIHQMRQREELLLQNRTRHRLNL